MENVRTVNIEKGMPRLESAKQMLLSELAIAKKLRVRVLKVIHGYGSSGTGGTLRVEIRRMLGGMKNRLSVINGEDFSIFNEETRALLALCPELRRDRDLENANAGVTFIILK